MLIMDKNKLINNILDMKFVIGLSVLFLLILVLSYHFSGPAWDIIVHYLNAKSYLSNRFYQKNFSSIDINGWEIQQNTFYIEPLREAIPSAIFVPLILIFQNPILPYMIALYIIFILSIWFFSRALKFDKILTYCIMLSPFFIYFSLLVNSTEILSVSFLLITLGFLYKKNPLAGLFLGLAALSKDPNLIFLPLLLFSGNKKRIVAAYSLFVLITVPWLAFNYMIYGNPFYAYLGSVSLNITTSNSISIPIIPFLVGLFVPVMYLILGLRKKFGNLKSLQSELKTILKNSKFTKISILFSCLAVLAYFIIALHTDFLGQIRYAYLIYTSASLFALIILQNTIRNNTKVLKEIMIFAFLLLIVAFFAYYYEAAFFMQTINVNSNISFIKSSINELNSMGYKGCRVESNSWPYLIYLNESAYSPLFLNNTVATEYPIIIFSSIGLAPSHFWNINQSKLVYSNSNFSIYLPKDATCIKS